MTKIIFGLGNPGKKYEHSRHNLGFRVLDALASDLGVSFQYEEKFRAETASASRVVSEKIILVKPQTFMNNSGQAVAFLKNFFKLENRDLLVVQDEIDLPLGQIRFSQDRSSAGHRGIESIIEQIGQDFLRLRLGIDARQNRTEADTDAYVMAAFTADEEKKLEKEIIPRAAAEIKKRILKPTYERKAKLDKPVLP